MNTKEITDLLKKNETDIKTFILNQPSEFWEKAPESKWTVGQHVIHLVQSTKPLVKALSLPYFLIKWRLGKSNRPSRTYSEVVDKYNEKLSKAPAGIVGPFSRNMPTSPAIEAQKWFEELSTLNTKLNNITLNTSDKNLESVIIPHPLMGKMTLREILMWNAYHIQHHLEVLKKKYTD